MRRKWMARLGSLVATVVVAIVAGRVYSAQVMKPVPVTVVAKWDSYDQSGKYVRTRTKIAAVRSDGSQADIFSLTTPEGVFFDNRTVYDWQARQKISTMNVAKSKNTRPLTSQEFDARNSARTSCASDPNRERSIYQGYEVVKDIFSHKEGNGEAIRESWLAPALNCLELRRVFTTSLPGGQRVVQSRIETQVVSLGEPDPALFRIPDDYVERSSKGVIREAERVLGLPPRPFAPNFPSH